MEFVAPLVGGKRQLAVHPGMPCSCPAMAGVVIKKTKGPRRALWFDYIRINSLRRIFNKGLEFDAQTGAICRDGPVVRSIRIPAKFIGGCC